MPKAAPFADSSRTNSIAGTFPAYLGWNTIAVTKAVSTTMQSINLSINYLPNQGSHRDRSHLIHAMSQILHSFVACSGPLPATLSPRSASRLNLGAGSPPPHYLSSTIPFCPLLSRTHAYAGRTSHCAPSSNRCTNGRAHTRARVTPIHQWPRRSPILATTCFRDQRSTPERRLQPSIKIAHVLRPPTFYPHPHPHPLQLACRNSHVHQYPPQSSPYSSQLFTLNMRASATADLRISVYKSPRLSAPTVLLSAYFPPQLSHLPAHLTMSYP